MSRGYGAWLLLVTGCGRISFDPARDADHAADVAACSPPVFCDDFERTGTTGGSVLGATLFNAWDRLQIGLVRSSAGATPSLLVTRNGTTLVDAPADIVLGDISSVHAGITYAPAGAAEHVFIDDVRIE